MSSSGLRHGDEKPDGDIRPHLPNAWTKTWFLLVIAGALIFAFTAFGQGVTAPAGMVYVPAGDFLMGDDRGNFDERPAHRVRLSAYFIDVHEVTVGEFNA